MDSAQCYAGIVGMSQSAVSIRLFAPRSRGQRSTKPSHPIMTSGPQQDLSLLLSSGCGPPASVRHTFGPRGITGGRETSQPL
jgi:hypothetical protein